VLIAEDLLLLLLDDESGGNQSSFMRPALGGALLVELAMAGCVVVGPRRWTGARVEAVPGAPAPEDPFLGAAYATAAARPRTAQDLVNRLGKDVQPALAERLVERGILERHETRVLGLFPRTRWPARDALHEEQVRRSLEAVLVGGQDPDERTAALIALLSALDRAHKAIDRGGVSGREVKRRAKEVAEGNWAAKGVREAVQAATTAMMVATTAGGAAAASGGS
jgi:hypothetical protein